MYQHLTAIEADHRRDHIAREFRKAERRYRHAEATRPERRWRTGRRP
jgi:hypothetical protein